MTRERPAITQYLIPSNWGIALLLGFVRLIAALPLPMMQRIGSGFGSLLYALFASRRRVARINIRQAYPEMDEQAVNRMVRAGFQSLGISVFEMGMAWWAERDYLRQRCRVSGLEHIDEHLKQGRGVILLTAHFTTLEIGGILMGLFRPLNAVYKPAHNRLFNQVMVYQRARHLEKVISNREVRDFIRTLKDGELVWYAPDQDSGGKGTVFAPFLGGMASTLTSAARMAKMTGAAIIPYYPVRLPDGAGYELIVKPALEDFPSGDDVADATRINQAMEAMIHEQPEQYAWIHKRFKHQPDGAPSIYRTPS